jgi:predicted nucleic acid-binding protein
MKTYIVDTYAWISYFEGQEAFKEEIEDNELETPSIVLAEITRVFRRKRLPRDVYLKTLNYIKRRSLILPLDTNHAIKSGEIAEKEELYLIDAIIYSYVSEDKDLLTGDEHFRGKPSVKLLK